MKVIPISGVIGWDVSAKEVRAQLDAANGEPIEAQISSAGGIILPALEIFNLIKNYKGPKVTRLMGLAGSAASYVALAGDRVIGEENMVYMMHNAQGGAMGDQRDMQKMADILSGFSGMMARAYAAKCGKSIKDVAAMMNDETWLFGAEALDAGFVDEIVPATQNTGADKAAAMAMAHAKFEACRKIIADFETSDTLMQAVALIPQLEKPAGVAGAQPAAQAAGNLKTGGVKRMTLDELKRDHPALYAEATSAERQAGKVEGIAEGVKQERERYASLDATLAADAGNAKLAAIVAEAKASGKAPNDPGLQAQINVAIRDGTPKVDADNPPPVTTGVTGTGAANAARPDIAADAKKAGVSPQELKAEEERMLKAAGLPPDYLNPKGGK